MYSELQDIGQVKIADVNTGVIRQVTMDDRERGRVAVSPSGRYVAFPAQEIDAISTSRNIYVISRDGGNPIKLTDDHSFKNSPAWSPDEKWITYSGRQGNEPEDSSEIFLIRADRPGQARSMGQGRSALWFSEREIVIWRFSGTYKRSIDQPEGTRISEDSTFVLPVLDEKYVVGLDWRAGREGWMIATAASFSTSGMASARRLTNGLSYAVFPRNTRDMFYVPMGTTELHRIPLPDGNDRFVRSFPGLIVYFSMSSDAREIAYTESYRKMRFVLIENVFR